MSIVITDLEFAYGLRTIFDGLSCRFDEGAMTGLVGPSGTGKSTLLALIMGHLKPRAGVVSYSRELTRGGAIDPARVAWVMQTSNVFARRTALENVALPVRCGGVGADESADRAVIALDSVRLTERRHDRCGLLSGGERQRVAVARALATQAPLLIADEPTVSLDQANRALLVEAIQAVARAGRIVIVATHDPAVYRACDTVVEL